MTGSTRLTAALSDRYRIERELGAGGMAMVYLTEEVRHHRRVAVKVAFAVPSSQRMIARRLTESPPVCSTSSTGSGRSAEWCGPADPAGLAKLEGVGP